MALQIHDLIFSMSESGIKPWKSSTIRSLYDPFQCLWGLLKAIYFLIVCTCIIKGGLTNFYFFKKGNSNFELGTAICYVNVENYFLTIIKHNAVPSSKLEFPFVFSYNCLKVYDFHSNTNYLTLLQVHNHFKLGYNVK